MKKLLSIIKENNIYAQFYQKDKFYVHHKTQRTLDYEKQLKMEAIEIGDEVYNLNYVNKILTATIDIEEKKRWMKLFKSVDEVDGVESTVKFYEIVSKGVSKGNAVRKLGQILNVDMSEVMVMGDAPNDESMLQVAGYPVVMGQADESMKKGRIVTDTCANAGVSKAIEKYCFGNEYY